MTGTATMMMTRGAGPGMRTSAGRTQVGPAPAAAWIDVRQGRLAEGPVWQADSSSACQAPSSFVSWEGTLLLPEQPLLHAPAPALSRAAG